MAGIKHVKVPAPVPICNDKGEPFEPALVIGLPDIVVMALEHDGFIKSRKGFQSGEVLAEAFKGATEGAIVAVADDDLSLLVKAFEDRSIFGVPGSNGIARYTGRVLRQLGRLFRAIEGEPADGGPRAKREDWEPPAPPPAPPVNGVVAAAPAQVQA